MNTVWLIFRALGLCFGLVMVCVSALAHHSFAMFDFDQLTTLEGSVEQFQWSNPHVVIWFSADAENGEAPQLWGVELSSPGNLLRAGWTKRSLKPGDRISVTISPLRSGNAGGAFRKLTLLASGEDLTYDWARLAQVQDGAQ